MQLRVVVVDDHAGFRHQARLVLEEAGCQVIGEAEDATGAVAMVRRLQPDIVLLDVHLLDADAFAVIDELSDLVPAPAVVLISGRDRADYGAQIERSGALEFIAKADLTPTSFRQAVAGARPG